MLPTVISVRNEFLGKLLLVVTIVSYADEDKQVRNAYFCIKIEFSKTSLWSFSLVSSLFAFIIDNSCVNES